MTMPKQKTHRSKQDYETPGDFLTAVIARFGPILWDLAADTANTVVSQCFTPWDDSLSRDWHLLTGNLWLNPPFANIDPWAAKCAASLRLVQADARRRNRHDWRVLLLTPASIGTDWFADHMHRKALVLGLSPRLTFGGADDPYPKDLMLSVFGEPAGFDLWRWSDRR